MAVGQVKGVSRVEADARKRTVKVQYDQALVSLEQIKATMREIGYEAEVAAE